MAKIKSMAAMVAGFQLQKKRVVKAMRIEYLILIFSAFKPLMKKARVSGKTPYIKIKLKPPTAHRSTIGILNIRKIAAIKLAIRLLVKE